MIPMLVSVDKAGDLKLGNKKCRLHKKEDIIKVAKMYKVSTPEKKTIKQLCNSIKGDEAAKRIARMKISNYNKVKLGALFSHRSPSHVVRVARELARLG
jgi:hypothetical protein